MPGLRCAFSQSMLSLLVCAFSSVSSRGWCVRWCSRRGEPTELDAPAAAKVFSLDVNAWPIPIKTMRTAGGEWVPRSPWLHPSRELLDEAPVHCLVRAESAAPIGEGVEGLPEDGKLDLQKIGLTDQLSMRVRVGRNLTEFNLPGAMDKARRGVPRRASGVRKHLRRETPPVDAPPDARPPDPLPQIRLSPP